MNERMVVPDYLAEPSLEGHIYGKLIFNSESNRFELTGEPLLLQYAKRIFPGARVTRKGGGKLEFHRTRREVADLNWLLMRFPVDVSQCEDILSGARDEAIHQLNSRMSGNDLTRVTPPSEFTGKLYPFQESAASFLTTNKRCLLSDGMGLGKTWSSLAAASIAGEYPVLVVCQTHVQRQWQRAIGSLFNLGGVKADEAKPFESAAKNGEALAPILSTRTPYEIPNAPFAIIHYGLIAWWDIAILKQNFKTVIFDEVQELRHTGTGKYSAASKISENALNVFANSGTPVFGYGREIWAVMNAIDFHCLGSEEAFSREWCAGYGERIVSDPLALNGHLSREGLMLRRRAHDPEVAIDLPKIIRHVQDIGHDSEMYDRLIQTTHKKAKDYKEANFTAKGRLARDIERESRQATGLAKAEYVAEFVASLLEAGERPLVFAWHHAVHDIYKERLKEFNPAIFTGKQSMKQKEDSLRRFMDGETDVAMLSLRSAAGLDGLQHRATMCVFGELDWSPACMSQCETRIARIGVDGSLIDVPSYYCVTDVGHDEVMLDVLGVKTGQFIGLMGDEPESYEEKKQSEDMALNRISMLVNKLRKEGTQSLKSATKKPKLDNKLSDCKSDRERLLDAFSGKLRRGKRQNKENQEA